VLHVKRSEKKATTQEQRALNEREAFCGIGQMFRGRRIPFFLALK